MSHGSSADKCEPNLIPLLDLVLQLIMFFMLCANFLAEQTNATIKLPEAVQAKALDKDVQYAIFLNINEKGQVLLSSLDSLNGRTTLENAAEVYRFMDLRYKEDLRAAGGDATKPPRSVVILRADRKTEFGKVAAVMDAVQRAKYERVQLRAIRFGGQEK